MNIHIQRDGQQMGPYTLEQINEHLAQGSMLATDHAWHEGLPQWVPLNEIAGVVSKQEAVASAPPTLNSESAATAGKSGNKKKLLLFGGIGVGVVALITIVAVLVLGGGGESPTVEIADPIVGTYESNANPDFTLIYVLMENGMTETYVKVGQLDAKKGIELKWKIVNGELHLGTGQTFHVIHVYRINEDGSITLIAHIRNGTQRTDRPKEEQATFKKIK